MNQTNPTEQINKKAEVFEGGLSEENLQKNYQEEVEEVQDCREDDEDEGGGVAQSISEQEDKVVKYIKTPNFTDCGSNNSQLPIGTANETIIFLSRLRAEIDFVDFVKEKLKYNSRVAVCSAFLSEQIDALVLAIKQFESNKALILGDMAGMGKGRVVAGVLRYAFVNKLIPIFITEKENLFSDMYRDLMNIGGFGIKGGEIVKPKPFILRELKKETVITDNDDGTVTRTRIAVNNLVDDNGYEFDTTQPLKAEELKRILQDNDDFPFKNYGIDYGFNCIFLNYDVIGKTKDDKKRYLLRDVASKSIFVFDECHNASGESKVGEWAKVYVTEAKGVMFSSATFAKNSQAFPLYIIKTSMAEAQIDLTQLEKAMKVGGENVSEYISSVLAKEGQMIRRDRDFTGCTVGTIYDGYDIRNPIERENKRKEIFKTFNNCVNQFSQIIKYIKKPAFGIAVLRAVENSLNSFENEGYVMAQDVLITRDSPATYSYDDLKLGNEDNDAELKYNRREFIRKNRNKWVLERYVSNTINPSAKSHFSANLLNSIKTKFVAESVVKELKKQVEYIDKDGKTHKTNRKPVIAIMKTGQSAIKSVIDSGLSNGNLLENDFSLYVRSIVLGVRKGKVTFRLVNDDLFKSVKKLKEEGAEPIERGVYHTEEVRYYDVLNDDLPDGGTFLDNLISEINQMTTDIPLSPIDYIVDYIESSQREIWDLNYNFTNNLKYKVNEVTGRANSLKKVEGTNLWEWVRSTKVKSTKRAFNQFNSGQADVIILNASGSTGGSIHSSEEFKDKRQRIMFISEVELNVNTEVQKRGRINRTGQVNFPAYLYVLSQVPSEIRTFIALAKKMKKLDANVSANQSQNSNLLQLCDKNGKKIEDFFNIYGEEAFSIFLADEVNQNYRNLYNEMTGGRGNTEYVQSGEVVTSKLEQFTRELQMQPCSVTMSANDVIVPVSQEYFYDEMNQLYKDVVKEHKSNGTFQLELEVEDLKASLRSRFLKQLNNGESEFSKPLFVEDKYCLPKSRNWTKEKLSSEQIKLAKKFYIGRNDEYESLSKFHNDLLNDFELEYSTYKINYQNQYRLNHEPKRSDFTNDEQGELDYQEKLEQFDRNYTLVETRLYDDEQFIKRVLGYFKPDRPILLNNKYTLRTDASGFLMDSGGRECKFVGYVFKKSSGANKYSKGSIHLRFAFVQRQPVTAELSLARYEHTSCLIDAMNNNYYSLTRLGADGKTEGQRNIERLNKWETNPNYKEIVRFLSGNILSGISEANSMVGGEITRWTLVKYTNDDGTISTGIKLLYPEGEFQPLVTTDAQGNPNLTTINSKINVLLDNVDVVEYLKSTPNDYIFKLTVNTKSSTSVPNDKGVDENVTGLIKIKKIGSNKVEFEIFQGTPMLQQGGVPANFKGEERQKLLNNTPFLIKNCTSVFCLVNNPIFFAPFLNQYTNSTKTYNSINTKEDGINGYRLENSKYPNGVLYAKGNSKIYTFDNIDTASGEDRIRKFLLKIHNEQSSIKLEFPTSVNDYYNIPYQKDVAVSVKSDEKKVVKVFEDGEYKYAFLFRTTNENDERLAKTVPSFKSFENGIVTLIQPLVPAYARGYNIYPINLSDKDTVKLFLSIFEPDEKAKFLIEVKSKINQDSISFGNYISQVVKKNSVPDITFIFGKRRTLEIADLIKNFATTKSIEGLSEIQDIANEEEDVETKVPKKTLKANTAFRDVENFLNYLLF